MAGTRIPTRAIWEFYNERYDVERILAQYPALTEADVEAALAHERDLFELAS